jgi:hypothetical protein
MPNWTLGNQDPIKVHSQFVNPLHECPLHAVVKNDVVVYILAPRRAHVKELAFELDPNTPHISYRNFIPFLSGFKSVFLSSFVINHKINRTLLRPPARVTRLGAFSPFGRLVTLGSFSEIF